MLLSIITINRNDAKGLQKTVDSVAAQAPSLAKAGLQIEHVIVDGASTDNSVEVARQYAEQMKGSPITVNWISEPDKGIYNAMNKGIRMASGDYIQILNSADILAGPTVCARMLSALKEHKFPNILYGNEIKQWPDGRTYYDTGKNRDLTMLSFYRGTLNHAPTYIRKSLFSEFGYYDESLRIVSDWAWFLRVIPLGGVEPIFVDVDVVIFDMTGVSESNTKLWPIERRPVLEREVPRMILADYDKYAADMRMMDRIRKHHLYKLVYFLERVLFKLEKWHVLN